MKNNYNGRLLRHLQLVYANRGLAVVMDTSYRAVRGRNGQWRALGEKGWPDLTLCVSGTFYAMEIKTLQGKQSTEQKAFQHRIEKAGGLYHIVRSVDEALNLLHPKG